MSVMILVKSALPEGSATPGLIISLIERRSVRVLGPIYFLAGQAKYMTPIK